MAGGLEWWTSGRHGTLSPWSQALVFALTTVSDKKSLNLTDTEIATEVVQIGGGHPTREAIRQLRDKFASDPQWYPGKKQDCSNLGGRPKVITGSQAHAIAKCAMSLKANGVEPTVSAVLSRCPTATLNHTTNQPFDSKVITNVFRTRCYDSDPNHPWQHLPPVHKTALSPELKDARLVWANEMLGKGHTSQWYFDNCIWMDPCSSIIPGSPKTAFDHKQSTYGKSKRWISANSKRQSRNLKASPYAGKQTQWADRKVWWQIVLCRGKVHIELMPEDWSQTGDGQAFMVSLLPAILKHMLGDGGPHPTIVFTDRGPGFYHPSTGNICQEYLAALQQHGFQPWAGECSKWQPPDIADVLLHETAVSWARHYMKKHPFKLSPSMDTNFTKLCKLVQSAVNHANSNYAVANLCHDLPKRLESLVCTGGDRLRH